MSVDLDQAAATAVGAPVTRATVSRREPIHYDPFLPGRTVERVDGVATLSDGTSAPWSAIVKRSGGVGRRDARRELAAYRTGVTGSSSALAAPALLAGEGDADHVELWLEPLRDRHDGRWPLSEFAVAARAIGLHDALMLEVAAPAGFDAEDAWAERHGQPERVDEARRLIADLRRAPGAQQAGAVLGDVGFTRTERLITATADRIGRLQRFPCALLHHDLVRSNLFALSDGSTAAIDWEHVGHGPLGVDLAPLTGGSVRRGEASADDLPRLEELVLDAYESALRARGIDASDVRPAYRLALALRWHVVLGTAQALVDPTAPVRRGSLPAEPRHEALRHLTLLSRHLLDAADALG